jgi:hypothetical protein
MTDIRRMRILDIYELAQTKLSSKCVQADHNLLLVVGHTNLLGSLRIHLGDLDIEDEMQRFDEELTSLKMEEDNRATNSKPSLAIDTVGVGAPQSGPRAGLDPGLFLPVPPVIKSHRRALFSR